jgi:hypothetical protein
MLELPVCGFMNSQESRLMKFERLIRTSLNRSPGFSRSRLAWSYAAALAGIQTGESRDSRMAYPGYLLNVHQPDQSFPAGCCYSGRHSTG